MGLKGDGYLNMKPLSQETHSVMMDSLTSWVNTHAFHMSKQTPGLNTSSKFVREYNGMDPYKNDSRMTLNTGTTSLGRPSPGRGDFMSSFNTTAATGDSPGTVAGHSEVRRVHVGMCKGDSFCPDCDGFVWSSKADCERDKCQRRGQDEVASVYVETNPPSRTMEHKLSVTNTPPVTNERTELRDTSIVIDDLEDTSCSTDISPVAFYVGSGVQTELKRARGVRDPPYQREILQGQRPVWKDDRCTWEFSQQKAPGGLDTVVESTTQVCFVCGCRTWVQSNADVHL